MKPDIRELKVATWILWKKDWQSVAIHEDWIQAFSPSRAYVKLDDSWHKSSVVAVLEVLRDPVGGNDEA